MKKLALSVMALMVFILPLTMTYNQQQASANIISKPLTITAKKVAKELAEESAVAMANDIVSQFLVRELIEGVKVDDGYTAACLDGAKDNLKDCPANKRVQVKTNLSSSDRSTLASTVENVLEQKTNTSHKWQKFLDFFIPIFLISGVVATFDSVMDGDSESLIDEIAQQALIDAGLLKPVGNVQVIPRINWTDHINSVQVSKGEFYTGQPAVFLDLELKPNAKIKMEYLAYGNSLRPFYIESSNNRLGFSGSGAFEYDNATGNYKSIAYIPYMILNQEGLMFNRTVFLHETAPLYKESDEAQAKGNEYLERYYDGFVNAQNDVNAVMNLFVGTANSRYEALKVDLLPVEIPNEVPTDYGTQKGLDKTKNPDGTKTLPGVDSFTYTYNNTNVYPATDSTTGWKDKTTGEDITVVEDDVIVDGGTTPTDPETPPGEEETPNTDKDKDKIKDKSRDWSGLLTDKFPFSLPWDFLHLMGFLFADPMTPEWEIRGTEKIPFNLNIDLKFFDPYAPWFRTFIFISFVVSVIFMHGRFMGGSK